MPEETTRGALFEPLVIRGIVERLRLQWLLRHFEVRKVWAAFMFINGFVSIMLLAMVALATGSPFVFPSLGPTAFLFFFDPRAPSATPHHALIGHAIGILCGYGSLLVFGLQGAGSALADGGMTWPRVLAAALSLAATGALMILFNAAHPPAGATTLIISLGAITGPYHLLTIEVALALLALQAIVINRLAGLDYPLWRAREP